MTDIARTQFFLMVKMQRRGSLSYDSLNDSGKDDLNFLKNKGYVRISRPASPGASARYSVTAAGRAALYAFRSTFLKWWIPVVISVASFIVSVIALLR